VEGGVSSSVICGFAGGFPDRAPGPAPSGGVRSLLVSARELNFDGLVGPTHHYAGLSPGNLASETHAGQVGNPRAAALQGLEKMRFLAGLGVGQAVLPPQPRPDLELLGRLGFGDGTAALERAAREAPAVLSAAWSASAMWAANAATVAPSADTADGRVHLVPANLTSMLHRSVEPRFTTRLFRRVFADGSRFVVHEPLPATDMTSDEGAANHTRLSAGGRTAHLFAWGRAKGAKERPERHPARQTREASQAVARLLALRPEATLLWQQHPSGIDQGAFHTDVLAVGNDDFLMLHELAFRDGDALLAELRARFGGVLTVCVATERELPTGEAVQSYPFNSQLVTLPGGAMAIVAPSEAERSASARRFLERVVAEENPVSALHFVDVNDSMRNGGGPACLRLRVRLTPEEESALAGHVLLDDDRYQALRACIAARYRDRVTLADLVDPRFVDECRVALDEITAILGLASVYDFQRA
jgi:succinylarginine dihydrolase